MFWRGRRVLLTGHTGFKGSWLALWLARLGANVTGLAMPPSTNPNLYEAARVGHGLESRICDIRDAGGLRAVVHQSKPEVVLHLAAQALVRAGYREPVETYATNVMGTVHLLDALRGLPSIKVALLVTTDKVYRNREWSYPYREGDTLGGHDPYSASKAASEIVIASYRDAFLAGQGVAVASARAGNVIGGGDWAPERLIPDAVRAWTAGALLDVRFPDATRPWQHVLEPLAAYLTLAQRLWDEPALAGAWNFGPAPHEAATVGSVIELAARDWPGAQSRFAATGDGLREAGVLALEVAQARQHLGVRPRWPLATAIGRTIAWYRAAASGADARGLCEADITAFEMSSG